MATQRSPYQFDQSYDDLNLPQFPSGTARGGANPQALSSTLTGLMQGGGFNQGLVNQRTGMARDTLNQTMKSRNATNQAQLAERGLLGSGPEWTAQNRAESDLGDRYAQTVSGIYANESQNADARMAQALGTAAGMSNADAANAVERFRIGTERELGLGNLGVSQKRLGLDTELGRGQLGQGQQRIDLDKLLGLKGLDLQAAGQGQSAAAQSAANAIAQGRLGLDTTNAANQYNLDLARFGFDRDRYQESQSNMSIDQLIQLLGGL